MRLLQAHRLLDERQPLPNPRRALLPRHFGVTLQQQESGVGGFVSAGCHLRLPEFPKPVQTTLHRAIVVAALVFQGKDFA